MQAIAQTVLPHHGEDVRDPQANPVLGAKISIHRHGGNNSRLIAGRLLWML
jgi:hypothetical protein